MLLMCYRVSVDVSLCLPKRCPVFFILLGRFSGVRTSGFILACDGIGSFLGRLEERVRSVQIQPRGLILLGGTLSRRIRGDQSLEIRVVCDGVVRQEIPGDAT